MPRSVDAAAWAGLLQPVRLAGRPGEKGKGIGDVGHPPWRHWAQILEFLCACAALEEDTGFARAAPVVQASRLRDLAERFARTFERCGIAVDDPSLHAGELYMEAFDGLLARCIAWTVDHA